MRYTKERKAETRKLILFSAIKLFSRRGFDNVSIDEIMEDAGFTRGAFYAHFKNKQELYSEAILSNIVDDKLKLTDIADRKSALKLFISNYLEADYSNPDVLPCPLAYLVTDVANREPEVRTAYAKSFKSITQKIRYLLSKDNSDKNDEIIYAITSMMIGSVAISRTIQGTSKTKLLNDCKKTAYKLIDST